MANTTFRGRSGKSIALNLLQIGNTPIFQLSASAKIRKLFPQFLDIRDARRLQVFESSGGEHTLRLVFCNLQAARMGRIFTSLRQRHARLVPRGRTRAGDGWKDARWARGSRHLSKRRCVVRSRKVFVYSSDKDAVELNLFLGAAGCAAGENLNGAAKGT